MVQLQEGHMVQLQGGHMVQFQGGRTSPLPLLCLPCPYFQPPPPPCF